MNTRYATILQILLFAVSCSVTTGNVCYKIDPCSCRTPFGDEYSLQALDNITAPAFRVEGSEAHPSFFYEYSPCTPLKTGKCKDAMICQTHKTSTDLHYNLGTYETFHPQFVGKNLEFHYTGLGSRHGRIILKCDPNATTPEISHFTETQPTTGSVYTATLTSMYACPRKLNSTCPTMKPTTEPEQKTQRPTKPSTKLPSSSLSCQPCPTYGKELVLAIIVLLLVQLVSYIVIGFAWYRKFYVSHVGTYNHKSFKNLEQPLEDDNRYPNY